MFEAAMEVARVMDVGLEVLTNVAFVSSMTISELVHPCHH